MTITKEQMIRWLETHKTLAEWNDCLSPKDVTMIEAILTELTKQSGNGKMRTAEEWYADVCYDHDPDQKSVRFQKVPLLLFIREIQADALNAKQDGMTLPELPEGFVCFGVTYGTCRHTGNNLCDATLSNQISIDVTGIGKTPREAVLNALSKINV